MTSRSPLGTAVKDATWEEEGAVAARGGPQIFVACGPAASSAVDPNLWICLRAVWCHGTWLGVGLGWRHREISLVLRAEGELTAVPRGPRAAGSAGTRPKP